MKKERVVIFAFLLLVFTRSHIDKGFFDERNPHNFLSEIIKADVADESHVQYVNVCD